MRILWEAIVQLEIATENGGNREYRVDPLKKFNIIETHSSADFLEQILLLHF